MENELEEVERDYIEFRKEIEEEEHRKSEKRHIQNSDNARDPWIKLMGKEKPSQCFFSLFRFRRRFIESLWDP